MPKTRLSNNTNKPLKNSDSEEIKINDMKEDVVIANNELEQIKKELEELKKIKKDLEVRGTALTTKADVEGFKSPLINKRIKIMPIEKNETVAIKDKNEASMLTKTSRSIVVPVLPTGRLIDPLTDFERAYLQKVLNIDLSANNLNPANNFWAGKNARLVIKKPLKSLESAAVELNLNNPYDYILYKIALVNPRVAKNWGERHNDAQYEFVIVDEMEKVAEEIAFNEMEDYVVETLLQKKFDHKYLFDLLRLYGSKKLTRAITLTTPLEILYNEVKQLTRQKKEIEKLYYLMKMDASDFSHKIFLEDAITTGLLEIRGNEYRMIGGQPIGYSKEEAISFFKNPENQSIKLQLQAQIKNKINF